MCWCVLVVVCCFDLGKVCTVFFGALGGAVYLGVLLSFLGAHVTSGEGKRLRVVARAIERVRPKTEFFCPSSYTNTENQQVL